MQILSAEQIRLWDEFTIQGEPISSIDLMERAATSCLEWMEENNWLRGSFHIFCGKGNNGGDGLALARMLSEKKCPVLVHILEFGHKGTHDFQLNLARLHETDVEIRFIQTEENFHEFKKEDIIIDALFGSGLNRPLEGVTAALISHLNTSGIDILSIDIPSGLFSDKSSAGNVIVKAKETLSFQCYKLAFLMPENEAWIGNTHILNIGLLKEYLSQINTEFSLTGRITVSAMIRPRKQFANKGNFGHALMIAGGYGKMGAAVISAKACLRTGAGLLTCHIPSSGNVIMQTAVPESMLVMDDDPYLNTSLNHDLSKYGSIGIGPGIGTADKTAKMLEELFNQYRKPVVVDADALNILGMKQSLISQLPPYSILTPHPKEFERLFGPSKNNFEQIQLAIKKAKELQCIILLKGHYTLIATPEGKGYFNSTGNAGMAKGGSGDALTGMILSLVAQGYSSAEAAILGVYLHGLAGDIAASTLSEQSMLASDIIEHIGSAFLSLQD